MAMVSGVSMSNLKYLSVERRNRVTEETKYTKSVNSNGVTVFTEVKPERKGARWILSVYMDTDDDAEIIYEGKTYCYYQENLHIVESFETKESAVKHLKKNLRVACGGKASRFTHEWLQEAYRELSMGELVTPISGNQQYTIGLTYEE